MQVIENSNLASIEQEIQQCSLKTEATPGCENRAHTRYLVQRKETLKIINSPPAIQELSDTKPARLSNTVHIQDLSKAGIGWVNPVQLFPMELVEIRLQRFTIMAQVVRCRQLSAGDFEIGGIIRGVETAKTPHV